jgi:hypothetical protein
MSLLGKYKSFKTLTSKGHFRQPELLRVSTSGRLESWSHSGWFIKTQLKSLLGAMTIGITTHIGTAIYIIKNNSF